MTTGEIILGVDGGNTKTVALVARPDGTILGSGRSGCSDIYAAPSPEAALDEVERAARAALQAAGVARDALASGCFSLAGADWPEDFALIQEGLARRRLGHTLTVVNDAIGGLYAGLPSGIGVAVVCGTGVAIGARGAEGQLWHTSWWQGPQGSRDLGRRALRAICRAELGIDPPTALSARVLAYFGMASVEQVLHRLTARERRLDFDPGQLARLVLDEAGAGDATARRIVRRHGAALGAYVLAAARRVGIEALPFTLVLAGSVLRHDSPLLRDTIVERVLAKSPDVQPLLSRFEPAVGALLIALESAGVCVDAPLLARLTASLPPPALFAT
jgi:N-acetylglucosamine kinase-like BadF-type ATPase